MTPVYHGGTDPYTAGSYLAGNGTMANLAGQNDQTLLPQFGPGSPAMAIKDTATQRVLYLQAKVITLPATAITDTYPLGPVVDIVDIGGTAIVAGKFQCQIPHGYPEVDLLALVRTKAQYRFMPAMPAGDWRFEGLSTTNGTIVVWHYAEI